MKKRVILFSMMLVMVFSASAYSFGGLTIEEMIERYGVSRCIDRVLDLKELVMSSLQVTKLIPDDFKSADMSALNDISSLYKAWEREKQAYYSLDSSFWQKLWGSTGKNVIGSVIMGDGISSGTENSLLSSFNWTKNGVKAADQTRRAVRRFYMGLSDEKSAYQEFNDNLSLLDINKTVDNIAEEIIGNKYTESMKDFGSESVVSASGVMQGIITQPYAARSLGVQQAHLSEYTTKTGGVKLKKIAEIQAQADAIRNAVKEKHGEMSMKYLGAFTNDSGSSGFGGQSGALKALAAAYTTVAKDNILRQELIAQMYSMMALNIKMRNQYFSTFIYDYVNYTKAKLNSEIIAQNSNAEGV